MAEFTLLELHFENSDLTANAPYSYGEKDVDAGEAPPEEESSSKGALLAVLVGLGFCVAIAYVAKRRLGGEPDADGLETDPTVDGPDAEG